MSQANEFRNVRSTAANPSRNRGVELALAVMCALQRPGERVSHRAIAEVTGLSHGGSHFIERRALRKLRTALRARAGLQRELAA